VCGKSDLRVRVLLFKINTEAIQWPARNGPCIIPRTNGGVKLWIRKLFEHLWTQVHFIVLWTLVNIFIQGFSYAARTWQEEFELRAEVSALSAGDCLL
jgi:hypothetical protein